MWVRRAKGSATRIMPSLMLDAKFIDVPRGSNRLFHRNADLGKMASDAARSLLGLSSPFSFLELKKAFVAKAKELHPDVNPSNSATKEFADINEAFQVLEAECNPIKAEKLKSNEEKHDEALERELEAFRSWSAKRKRDKALELKNRQQSIMWLLASAVGVLIIGRVVESIVGVYPLDSDLKKFWGAEYAERLQEYNKQKRMQ